ncbi:NAD-dependent epimerase/dehydratase family protein [Chitinophaga rhizosphaerae]|uniref:NAD-dependent epimerase/dehydratase family protein n=1 Tax=Chitinophaga rhizosphaerae TaxID=1864947 RepID=UPI000F7FEFB2|nr:NAD-dependent epimerase/dehydratase family protein [Chitinophaga rhizosphaerae]
MPENLNVILTGATGMVGEGVLLECLQNPLVEKVLIINRRPSGYSHPKLKEIIHENFFNVKPIADQFAGYNACFFCLGVSSVGKSEPEYYRQTYVLTMHVAEVMAAVNTDIAFCYVSGSGTDGSERGRVMWARVKGKTENDLMKLPFRAVFAFRPGLLKATKGQKNLVTIYKYLGWMFPFFRSLFPGFASTLQELGKAMIEVSRNGYSSKVIEVRDIHKLAAKP